MVQRPTSPPPSPPRNTVGGRANTRSASPPAQPQSKRDKRRTMLSDKLSDMVASFSSNHFEHYYAQLSALQCDINLVMRADPYREGPLDDSKEDIDQAVAAAREEICKTRAIAPDAESSFTALAGQFYSKFVNDVNTALEERDGDLTALHQQYTDGMEELQRANQYKRQLAQQEHALLSKTLRERLIQTVTQKRAKLLRDKEQLDIADSNALLLNPTQFSIGNPASPGGLTASRKTRHTRGRPGETGAGGDDSAADSKRKRKAAYDEPDSGSPGPSSRMGDVGSNGTSHRDMRTKLMQSQFEAPLYSVERLFSEKELALNLNRAHYQTTEYFAKLRSSGLENRLHVAANAINSTNGTNGAANDSTADGDASVNGNGPSQESGANDEPTQSEAVDSPSLTPAQPHHATRAAHRANPMSSLADAASLATSLSQIRTGVGLGMPMAMASGNLMPPYSVNISTSASKTNATAPLLGGLPDTEAASDLLLMQRGAEDPQWERLAERCLEKPGAVPLTETATVGSVATADAPSEAASAAPTSSSATAPNTSTAATVTTTASTTTIGAAAGAAAAAPAMTRSQSGAGQAMRRTGSGLGGTDMRRTTSAADFATARTRR